MTNEEKVKVFEKELVFIKNPNIRLFAETAIGVLPDYFFEVGASSTSKYHPAYALGLGGLVKHTRSAIRIAMELFRLEWWQFTDDERDLIIASLILHDGWKHGINFAKFTVDTHPIIAANQINENENLKTLLSKEQFAFVIDCIEHHMGAFVYSYKTKEQILEKPKTKYAKFVHLADYLASRKCLEMNFDAEISGE